MKLFVLFGLVGLSCAQYWPVPAYSGPVHRPAHYPVAYGGYPYYYYGLSGLSGLSSGLQQPAVLPGAGLPGAGLPGSGVALPGSSVQFTGTGAGAFDVNGLTGFFGTGAAEWDGQGAGVFAGFGNAELDGSGQVFVGPGFGAFNNFDGSVGVQGTGALVAVGDGVSQFGGQGTALAAGDIRGAVINGNGLTNIRNPRLGAIAAVPSLNTFRNTLVNGLTQLANGLAPTSNFGNTVNRNFGQNGLTYLLSNQRGVTAISNMLNAL